MKTLLLAGLAVAAIASAAPALASQPGPGATAPDNRTAAARAVTRAELAQKVQRHFTRLDTDRDGVITKAEVDAAAQASRARMHQRVQKRGTAIFDRLDTNKDGVVTRAEAEPFFAKGQVDIAHAGPAGTPPRRNWDALISLHDANKDGAISRAEFEAGRAKQVQRFAERRRSAGMRHAGFGGRAFELADSDKDGRVTLAEATAAATAHFNALDANRDGTLSPDEMRQARQKMRAPRR